MSRSRPWKESCRGNNVFVQEPSNDLEVICLGNQEVFFLRSNGTSRPSSEVLFTLWMVYLTQFLWRVNSL